MFQPYIAKNRVFNDMIFDFYIANEVGKSWYDGTPQEHMPGCQWCVERLRPGMTVVDCGAHHGIIVTRPVGVGDKKARVPFEPAQSNIVTSREKSYSYGLLSNLFRKRSDEETIKTVALDDDLPRGLKLDFLKVDVEGYEVEALKGMRSTIAQKPVIA